MLLEVNEMSFKPKILGFLCNWCCYAGADLAGVSRMQYPPNIRVIRLMCSGRIDPKFIFEALRVGADGVFIGGCHLGDCHYLEGNYEALKKFELVQKLLKLIGFDNRVRLEWVSASEGARYAEVIKEFTEHLKNSTPARIVNVASYWAGDLVMDDLEFKKHRYNNNTAYRQSKQANRMLSVFFAEHLTEFNITVNACHPGDVNSQLSNDLGFGGSASPDDGAETPVWLATDKIGEQVTGKYFEHLREVRCRFSGERKAIEELYNICCNY